MFSDAPQPKLLMRNAKSQGLTLNDNQMLVGSGKSAINLILGYMRESGILISKNSQLLVPSWMGQWVYIAMLNRSIPVFEFNSEIKCIYVYHQFGFLQNYDAIANFAQERCLPIIEDSAHLLQIMGGKSKFNYCGEYSLSSPPKFFSMPPIGILESDNTEFRDYVSAAKLDNNKIDPYVISLRQNYIAMKANSKRTNINRVSELNYKLYSSYLFTHDTTRNAINRLSYLIPEYENRLRRIQIIYSQFEQHRLPIMSEQQSKIAVLKVPIFVSEKEIDLLKSREPWALNYLVNFDRNQNLLRTNYQKALAIPMHAQISESEFAGLIEKLAVVLS